MRRPLHDDRGILPRDREFAYDSYPRPSLVTPLNLIGGGYRPVSQGVTGALNFDRPHFMIGANAYYDNAHKTNDGTVNNHSGHTRFTEGTAFYRFGRGWFAGAGADWVQLSTTNYEKQSWHPEFGGGKDMLFESWSYRLTSVYRLPGSDHLNGVPGPLITFIAPSPATRHHVFFYEQVDMTLYHATVTDPSNLVLSDTQRGQRGMAADTSLGMMMRF